MVNSLASWCSLLACLFLAAVGFAVVVMIFTGRIDLRYLVSEANHEASMSRFQLLIFTFVIAIALFRLVELKNEFPEIPNGILTLLGISASTYAVGKGISYSDKEGITPRDQPPPSGLLGGGRQGQGEEGQAH
ncbi:MAG TPA: hypothetical protein VEI01_08070 [Terriglobales bacterium]|nr:hypothetical protein [Terriglobales bacterium]